MHDAVRRRNKSFTPVDRSSSSVFVRDENNQGKIQAGLVANSSARYCSVSVRSN